MRPFFMGHGFNLQPVNQDVQAQPHHVHKVPVPSSAFETKVLIRREVTLLQTQGDDQQHQHAQKHVKAVEASQHEERRAINTRSELQVHFMVGVVVLVALDKQENQT